MKFWTHPTKGDKDLAMIVVEEEIFVKTVAVLEVVVML